MHASCLCVSALLFCSTVAHSAITAVNSVWTDDFNFATPLTDSMGVPLTAGGVADGDGAVLQIGVFMGVDPFLDPALYGSAEWAAFTPLTGQGSANPHINTTMGDGAFDGFYGIGVTFDTAPASGTPSTGLPVGPARIGVRYWNDITLAGSTEFNTVTSAHPDWVLPAPATIPPVPASADLDPRSTDVVNGLIWEGGPASAFMTVPEPSVPLLGALGLAVLALRRRRRS